MNRSLTVSLKYGLFITASLIAYFLILKLFDLHNNAWLRMGNGLFMAAGIYFSIKYYKFKFNSEFTYVDGFKTGLLTGFIATGFFVVFMAIYMFHLDPTFPDTILRTWFDDTNQGAGILIIIILMEGLASTAVLTLMFMQIFKKSQQVGQQEHLIDHNSKKSL
ncbi:uncharacterized protein DUF4199 [Gelidibacter sediminis]|uniref:Uncharacterized protein DUF4199 n=1 Tax=Gelidibacter sediminis TaxID=1608710 RepID=A0A4R7Q8Q1_9FLAO|nr:DUF4199 domain-containing protein [Gelidibacter sediminis]TDU43372.1 uncharacterized protein DUF4199 [Gelidibacter sediminis]